MQETSIFWLRVATILYAAGLVHAILTILRKQSRLFRPALSLFTVGVVLHMVALVELTMAVGHLPADNFYETVSICGFLFALLFLFVHWRYDFSGLSVILFPLIFFMTLIGAMEIPVAGWSSPRVRSAWLLLHIMLILLGYAAILLTSIASVFYLIQERQLKAKRKGTGVFEHLPPLGTLDNLINLSMGGGFVFVTLGVIAGSTWAFIESGTSWIGESKIVVSLLTWGFYLVMVFLRASAGWRGRRAAFLSLSVLVFCAITWASHTGLRQMLTPR